MGPYSNNNKIIYLTIWAHSGVSSEFFSFIFIFIFKRHATTLHSAKLFLATTTGYFALQTITKMIY